MTTTTSAQFWLNAADYGKAALMAIGGAIFGYVEPAIEKGDWTTISFTNVWHYALAAAIVYLGKNFLTPPSKVIPLGK